MKVPTVTLGQDGATSSMDRGGVVLSLGCDWPPSQMLLIRRHASEEKLFMQSYSPNTCHPACNVTLMVGLMWTVTFLIRY